VIAMRAIVPSPSTRTERNVSPRRPAISDGGSRFMWRWVSAFRTARYSSRVAGSLPKTRQPEGPMIRTALSGRLRATFGLGFGFGGGGGSSAISGRGKGSGGDSGAASAVFSSGAGSGAGVAVFGVLSIVGPISSEASRPRGGGACCGAGAGGVSMTS
jgi:hypothetical protein